MGARKPIRSTPQAAIIHVRNFRALRDVLQSLGADTARILQSAGLARDLFDNSARAILYTDLDRLLSEAMRATGCRDLGLRIGVLQGIFAAGLPGLVSMNCATVREALGTIVTGLKTTDSGGALTLSVRDGVATSGYSVIIDDVKNVEQFCDASLAILVNAMRQFCGAHWRPDRVYLMNRPAADLDRIAQFFGAPVEYRAPAARITFSSAVLDWPVKVHDPTYREILVPILEKAIESADQDFLVAVKAVLNSTAGAERLSSFDVSRAVGVSVHVLSRRLKSAGITFTDLAEHLKLERAQNLLLKAKPIEEISSDLGFAYVSSFTRAFRKWAGQSPAQWRGTRMTGPDNGV
jgi:AraC-like DNA-binding protein